MRLGWVAMSDYADALDDAIEEITGQWDGDDPPVIHFTSGPKPVIADVDGELRFLSSRLIYAARTDREDIIAFMRKHDELPSVAPLSDFSHRFDKGSFEDLHPEDANE